MTMNQIGGLVSLAGLAILAACKGTGPDDTTSAKLSFVVQPASTIAGAAISVTVAADHPDADSVTLTLVPGPRSGPLALSGTTSALIQDGVAHFSALSIARPGSGVTLVATAGKASVTSTPFNVSPGPAAQVVFAVQPRVTVAGGVIKPVTVAITDAVGNTVTAAVDSVVLRLESDTPAVVVSGTTRLKVTSGTATFANLSIARRGTYRLVAAVAGMPVQPSAEFDVVGGLLAFGVQPANVRVAGVIRPAVTVTVRDSVGAVVPDATDAITLSWSANSPGGVLSGATTVAAVNGIATFADLSVDQSGSDYVMAASAPKRVPTESAPFDVGTPLAFASLTAGNGFTCGLTADGSAYCWGDNTFGQLGDSSTERRLIPVRVAGGLRFTRVSAGGAHVCGVTTTSHGYCWGSNASGQLGTGTTANADYPVPVTGGFLFITIAAGGAHSCANDIAHLVYCWGANDFGQLGNGTTTPRVSPTRVVANFTLASSALYAGKSHTCGGNSCWGLNTSGQLGDGTTANGVAPVFSINTFAHGIIVVGDEHSCTVQTLPSSGTGLCWGSNVDGQLGDPSVSTYSVKSVGLWQMSSITSITAGGAHTCAVALDGQGFCWGRGDAGQLGDGQYRSERAAVHVSGGLTFTALSAGARHTCGIVTGGAVWCWGDNAEGALGDGTTTGRGVPTAVVTYP